MRWSFAIWCQRPNDIDVVLPASMLPGTYIPVVVYAHGEVPSMNGLTVP